MGDSQQTCTISTRGDEPAARRSFIAAALPEGDFRRICVKPNWVKHEEDARFPIEALVTSSEFIGQVIEACLEKYPRAERILVGDVPLQVCDWPRLVRQSGVDKLIEKYGRSSRPRIEFRDLRRECYRSAGGFLVPQPDVVQGDAEGYREVVLDRTSLLDPVSDQAGQFRVSDYDPARTRSRHGPGFHHYLICGSVLASDLLINLPKMKTHQKAGITGALKNLVGINGEKAYLVHYRQGLPAKGGDEFAPDSLRLIRAQVRIREALQKYSRPAFAAGRCGWKVLRAAFGIRTAGGSDRPPRHAYVGSGSWYGNDTIWRMIYDLNRIVRYGRSDGSGLADTPQRQCVSILDGVVAGEGDGPLNPLPVRAGVVAASQDPFLLDMVMARLMGFDWRRIALLGRFRQFGDAAWAAFEPEDVAVVLDGKVYRGIDSLPIVRRFLPPPGWAGHIEAP